MVLNVLAGDIGGTFCRLALARVEGNRVDLARTARYRNAEHPDLDAILADFLAAAPPGLACCLAVAGPTDGRRVRFTNLDWAVDAAALAERFGFGRARLVNDFAAVGWGLDCLDRDHLATLQDGLIVAGAPRVALGAGTGLGVSLVTRQGDRYRPLPSEGGHIGFAPADPQQDRLLAFLRGRYGRASVERVLSGPGLEDLYRFCRLEQGLEARDRAAAAVSEAGLAGSDPAARAALGLFSAIYGQTAGDLALAARAEGGVFLAGGIAPRLLTVLGDGSFLAGFGAKGRFSGWMQRVPVQVVLDPDVGLKGAALAALTPD